MMRWILFAAAIAGIILAARPPAGEIEIELASGSKFRCVTNEVSPELLVVTTLIGELKLRPGWLSDRCRELIIPKEPAVNVTPVGEKPNIGIKIAHRDTFKNLDTLYEDGWFHEDRTRFTLLDFAFSGFSHTSSYSGTIEYTFVIKNVKNGDLSVHEHNVYSFTLTDTNKVFGITSKPFQNRKSRRQGQNSQSGYEFVRADVKVYINGHLIDEETVNGN